MSSVTIRDVADRAGVSPGTVSNYFHRRSKLGPETITRVAEAIDELGYVGNGAARMLRRGESTTLGHLTLEVGNPFFASVAEGVEQAGEAAGYSVFLANSGGSLHREQRYLDLFELQRIRGLVLSSVEDPADRIRALKERGIPSVVVDQVADPELCGSIIVDDELGGWLAVEHLTSIGRSRPAFVGGPTGLGTVASRLRGAENAASAAGARLEVIEENSRTIAAGRSVGEAIAARRPPERPDSIFAVNDLVAIGIMHGLMHNGIRVPDDIAIVGYDDIDFAADAVIPLTSVRRPGEEFGRAAVDLLLALIEGDGEVQRQVVFTPELIRRDSTVGRS